jgi:hypothetical protein
MKRRPDPYSGFTVNDNVVSRDVFGRVKRYIQIARRKSGRKLDARAASQQDADTGVPQRERSQNRREQSIAVFFGHAEADFTLVVRSAHGDDGPVERFNDLTGDRQQFFAAGRERNAAPMSIEQLLPNDLFEFLYLEADSRLSAKQTHRAAADASGPGDRQKTTQQIAIELREQGIVLAHTSYLYYSFHQWKRAP